MKECIIGLLLPFLGTALGAAAVFLPRRRTERKTDVTPVLCGVAAGVMTAASVWSLLLPAVESASGWGRWAFLPATVGLLAGVFLFILLERFLERTRLKRDGTTMMTLAVTVHNLPEGIAVGVVAAGFLASLGVTEEAVLTLALGIAAQNIPEGAILSLPRHAAGERRGRAFLVGAASGLVEPLGAAVALLISRTASSCLPFLLSFAAGAMLYVVTQELIPATGHKSSPAGAAAFAVGFALMMTLDVALA